jgi:hypothetical protein
VGTLSDGRFGLVKTTGKGQRRQKVASWLPLNAIDLMLLDWRGARPRSRARVSQLRPEVVSTTEPNTLGRAKKPPHEVLHKLVAGRQRALFDQSAGPRRFRLIAGTA